MNHNRNPTAPPHDHPEEKQSPQWGGARDGNVMRMMTRKIMIIGDEDDEDDEGDEDDDEDNNDNW